MSTTPADAPTPRNIVGSTAQQDANTAIREPVVIGRRLWRATVRELRQRGRGSRESGAFLLARLDRPARVVTAVMFDDLDPDCLTGGISFASSGFTPLWKACEIHGLTVVADVHTHPGRWVQQSTTDRTNPMIATRGHLALIIPNYARSHRPTGLGAHVHLGRHQWDSRYGPDAHTWFQVRRALPFADLARRLDHRSGHRA